MIVLDSTFFISCLYSYCISIFKNIIEFQNSINRTSQLCEIGVHHGKSFIPMLKFSGESVCHCIDIFDEQSLNIDSSGKGDFSIFWKNIKKFKVA